jgi:chemotaxis protein CheC
MAINSFENLDSMHVDALTEIGNIGSGNAVSALSSMTQQNIRIKVPKVEISELSEVITYFGGAEYLVAGLLVTLNEDIDGMILYMFGADFVNVILTAFFGAGVESLMDLDDMHKSALLEIGNVMAASYVNALSQMTGLTIDISVPSMSVDYAGSLLATTMAMHTAISGEDLGDKVLFINDCFVIDGKELDGHMILVPAVKSLNVMFSKLGVEV